MARQISSPEVMARHFATGVTKYTLDEIVAADAVCTAAEQALEAARARAGAILYPHYERYMVGKYTTGGMAAHYCIEDWTRDGRMDLLALQKAAGEHVPSMQTRTNHVGRGDPWPVSQWLRDAARVQRQAARINRLCEACER